MKKKLNEGFTLVELMVVVAIIGMLSAVAVPNFKKYQAKAKIAEAKLQLSAIYTAEAGFFSDYNMYHYCLAYMGYDPGLEAANRYYMTGFYPNNYSINLTALASAVNSGLNTGQFTGCGDFCDGEVGAVSGPCAGNFRAGKGIGSAIANNTSDLGGSIGNQSNAANMTYTAEAIGIISAEFADCGSDGSYICSQLTIDQNKVLRTLRSGF
jgi:type IV pilus assembly protein PilA